MEQRTLGVAGPVSAVGLGCMGMSGAYGPTDRAEAIATIHAALDAGITLVDTGDFYGMGHNELLVAEALRGRDRDQVGPVGEVRRHARRRRRLPGDSTGGRRRSRTSSPTACSDWAPTTSTSTGRPDSIRTCPSRRPSEPWPSASRPAGCGTWACPRSGPTRSGGRTPSTRWPTCSSSTRSCPGASRPTSCPTTRELGIATTAYGALSRGLLSGNWSPDRPLAAGRLPGPCPTLRTRERGHQPGAWSTPCARVAGRPRRHRGRGGGGLGASRGDDIVPVIGAGRRPSSRGRCGPWTSRSTPDSWPPSRPPCRPTPSAGTRYGAPQMAGLDSER